MTFAVRQILVKVWRNVAMICHWTTMERCTGLIPSDGRSWGTSFNHSLDFSCQATRPNLGMEMLRHMSLRVEMQNMWVRHRVRVASELVVSYAPTTIDSTRPSNPCWFSFLVPSPPTKVHIPFLSYYLGVAGCGLISGPACPFCFLLLQGGPNRQYHPMFL